jgi:hypothetical protein
MSGLAGQATDIDIHAKEIIRTRASLNNLLASHTGQSLEKIDKDVERDFIMNGGAGEGIWHRGRCFFRCVNNEPFRRSPHNKNPRQIEST